MTLCIGRREFITLLGGVAAWPLAARAQQQERMRRIGVLMNLAAVTAGALISYGANATEQYRRAAGYSEDTTGVSMLASELDVKRLEVLHEFVPQARRIALLGDPTTISTRAQLARAAGELKVEPVPFEAGSPDELGRALNAIGVAKVEAVNVLASPFLQVSRQQIIGRMRDHRLPAIYQWPESVEDGGLLAYGPRQLLCYRHVISLVDKVLRGAKPADLPIEQPSKFELAVNLKTASAIGMTIPPTLLLRADEVIE